MTTNRREAFTNEVDAKSYRSVCIGRMLWHCTAIIPEAGEFVFYILDYPL